MSQVNTELGRSSTASISLGETAVRTLAGVASGAISMNDLRGKSAVTFTPAGGTSAGSPVYLVNNDTYYTEISVECSQNAVWTYSGGGAPGGGVVISVSIASGSTATIITFSISTPYLPRTANWSLSATSGGITRYWNVYLEVFGAGA